MKRFRTKRRNNNLFIVILSIIFLIVFVIVSFCKLNKSYCNLISFMLQNNIFEKEKNISFINKISSNLDYLIANTSFKKIKEEYKTADNIIYLYNTHDQEKYSDHKSVLDASILLSNNLKRIGIKSVVEERKVSDLIHTGLSNYEISRTFIMNNPNYQYYIDIHRDSVNNTKVTINNKDYAKILFVLGCDNKNFLENKKVMEKMNNYLNENYPGLSKGILEKSGSGVDGVYNQDLGSNVLLIEIGGEENNIDEVNNSTEIIALMLYHILGDDHEEMVKD